MMRKSLVSLCLAAGLTGGALATASAASADPEQHPVYAGAYNTVGACYDAGHAWLDRGGWTGFRCPRTADGQRWLLWLTPA